MSRSKKAKVGDWVRFYRDGRLVIGEVVYVEQAASWSKSDEVYSTDQGTVENLAVLESRASSGESR